MKKSKKILVIALSTMMLFGTMLCTEAATRDITSRVCPACGQSNLYTSVTSLHCSYYICEKTVHRYDCSRCGALYYVCTDGHYR